MNEDNKVKCLLINSTVYASRNEVFAEAPDTMQCAKDFLEELRQVFDRYGVKAMLGGFLGYQSIGGQKTFSLMDSKLYANGGQEGKQNADKKG